VTVLAGDVILPAAKADSSSPPPAEKSSSPPRLSPLRRVSSSALEGRRFTPDRSTPWTAPIQGRFLQVAGESTQQPAFLGRDRKQFDARLQGRATSRKIGSLELAHPAQNRVDSLATIRSSPGSIIQTRSKVDASTGPHFDAGKPSRSFPDQSETRSTHASGSPRDSQVRTPWQFRAQDFGLTSGMIPGLGDRAAALLQSFPDGRVILLEIRFQGNKHPDISSLLTLVGPAEGSPLGLLLSGLPRFRSLRRQQQARRLAARQALAARDPTRSKPILV